jgi:phosphoadenosine phosphosulfate reductase
MSLPDLTTAAQDVRARTALNTWLGDIDASERIAWALESLPGEHALSSSFGAQAAVSLHLATRARGDIPVVLIDTGYLFPETHRFAEQLRTRLALNLKIHHPRPESAWDNARIEALAEGGATAIADYNRVHKVEPMRRALAQLNANTWIAGIRRSQSLSRRRIDYLELRDGRWKLHPLADWTDRDIWHYMQRHDLPYHPLWHEGYVSIGDVHSTRRWLQGMRDEDTRFFGLARECGLHAVS